MKRRNFLKLISLVAVPSTAIASVIKKPTEDQSNKVLTFNTDGTLSWNTLAGKFYEHFR